MIWKHLIPAVPGDWVIEHKMGAHVISAAFQGDELVVWTAGNTDNAASTESEVHVRFTGYEAPPDADHVATLDIDGFVFHVFV